MDLDNENHSVTADQNGNLLTNSLANANVAAVIYEGTTNVTNNWTFATPVASNSGLGFSWNSNTKVATITSMAATLTEATLGFSALSKYYFSKLFTITKINAGANGDPAVAYSLIISPAAVKDNTRYCPGAGVATFDFTV